MGECSDNTAQYNLGRVGRRNVVIICLPAGQTGTIPATAVAVELRYKFPAVGIGGGVPNLEADIRLGDVVIGQPQGPYGGVVQYDFGKIESDGLHTRNRISQCTCLYPPYRRLQTSSAPKQRHK